MTLLDPTAQHRHLPRTARLHAARCGAGSVLVDAVDDAEWDECLSTFADGSLDQSAAYSRRRWGARRDSHLMLCDGRTPVAMARVATIALPALGGVAYVKFGPVWRRSATSPDEAAHRRMLAALVAEYCVRRGLLLVVQPRPSPQSQPLETEALSASGFSARRPVASPDRFFVDLALEPDAQRASLGQKWRYNLKKAERAGIAVEPLPGPAGFDLFARLHREMVDRKNAAQGDPIHLLPALAEHLPPAMRPLTAIARLHGEPVAGAIVATFGDTAYYLYGASREPGLRHNAGYALQWWLAGYLSAGGARWYDLGGAPEGSALRQFKTGLVGKRGRIVAQAGGHDRWTRIDRRIAGDALLWLGRAAQGWRERRGR